MDKQKVKVHLLGSPYVEINEERIHFPYKKMEGLFYYLCVKKNVTRDEIIQILWGGESENIGRKNLREALYQLKKIFGKEFLLISGRSGIGLNPENMPEIDWDNLFSDQLLEVEDQGFMTHFFIKNSYEYDEWLESVREQYNESLISWSHEKLRQAEAKKDIRKIQQFSNKLIKKDPYNEKIYCEIMEMYAAGGNYNMAIKLYYDLEKTLKEELGVEPSEDIVNLFHSIFNMKKDLKDLSLGREIYFYGRTKEIHELKECIDQFNRLVDPRCLAISGDIGVGKSVLMERGKKIAENYENIIFSASCYREESDFFLRPWRDIIEEIKQHYENSSLEKPEDSEQEERIFSRVFSENLLEDKGRETGYINYQIIEETILEKFKKIVKKHQVILFFDDIQWMDPMSFQLLNRLLLTFGLKKVILICNFRGTYEGKIMEALDPLFYRDRIKVMPIKSFTKEETEEIIEEFLPQLKNAADKKNRIYEMTEGNAFFLMELGNLIKEKGYTLELSRKTVNVIRGRLAGLTEKEREILDIISIFPEKVCVEEIELLLSLDRLDILRHLERLERRQLIKEILVGWNVYYSFVHRIFDEYVYESQSLGKKLGCHQILAQYFEKKLKKNNHLKQLPLIIYHYERGKNQLKTYQYKVQYYNEFYTIVHENFPVLHDEIEFSQEAKVINTGVVDIMILAEEITQWEDESTEAQQLKMEMNYITGRYNIAIGEYDSGKKHIKECIALAKTLKNKEYLLNSYNQMIFQGIQIEDRDQIKYYLDEIIKIIPKEKESYQYGVYLRLTGLYYILSQKYDEAEKILLEGIQVFENRSEGQRRHSMNIAACYNYRGDIRRHQSDYEGAYEFYCTAIETNTEKVMTNGLAHFYSNAGQMLYHLKRYPEAKDELRKALECFYKYDYRWGIGRAEAYMTLIELKTGNIKRALEHYKKGIEVERRIKNPSTMQILKKLKEKLKDMPSF